MPRLHGSERTGVRRTRLPEWVSVWRKYRRDSCPVPLRGPTTHTLSREPPSFPVSPLPFPNRTGSPVPNAFGPDRGIVSGRVTENPPCTHLVSVERVPDGAQGRVGRNPVRVLLGRPPARSAGIECQGEGIEGPTGSAAAAFTLTLRKLRH